MVLLSVAEAGILLVVGVVVVVAAAAAAVVETVAIVGAGVESVCVVAVAVAEMDSLTGVCRIARGRSLGETGVCSRGVPRG